MLTGSRGGEAEVLLDYEVFGLGSQRALRERRTVGARRIQTG
jgi:hypothetical protein